MSTSHSSGMSAHELSATLGGRQVLHEVSLEARRGQWTCVVGPNGAGKSTLLRAMACLQPSSGQLRWLGEDPVHLSRQTRALTLAWLGQSEGVASDLLARDVVMLGRLPYQGWLDTPTPQDQQIVDDAMKTTQSWHLKDRRLSALSGGERQRVLLARLMAGRAPLMLMDEPLAHLDPPHQVDWLEQMRCLRDQGTTLVTVLHDMGLALQADHLVVLQAGRVVGQGERSDPALHRTLEAVFEQRIRIVEVGGQWAVLPRLRP